MELLLVSHKGVASGIKNAASMIIGDMADDIKVIELTEEDGIEAFTQELEKFLTTEFQVETGLILADLKGGTPFNRAEMLLTKHELRSRIKVVSGMNLPVVLDAALRDTEQWTTQELTEIVECGQDGIASMDLVMQNSQDEDE